MNPPIRFEISLLIDCLRYGRVVDDDRENVGYGLT